MAGNTISFKKLEYLVRSLPEGPEILKDVGESLQQSGDDFSRVDVDRLKLLRDSKYAPKPEQAAGKLRLLDLIISTMEKRDTPPASSASEARRSPTSEGEEKSPLGAGQRLIDLLAHSHDGTPPSVHSEPPATRASLPDVDYATAANNQVCGFHCSVAVSNATNLLATLVDSDEDVEEAGKRIALLDNECIRGAPVHRELVIPNGKNATVTRFTPDDSRLLALAGSDLYLYAFDPTTKRGAPLSLEPVASVTGVVGFALSHGGDTVAVVNGDGELRFFATATGERIGDPVQVGSSARGVAYGPRDEWVAIVDDAHGGLVRRLPTKGQAHFSSLSLGRRSDTLVALAASDSVIVGVAEHNAVFRWDAGSGKPLGEPHLHDSQDREGSLLSALAMRADGKVFATACTDGTIRLWDTATGAPLGEPIVLPEGAVPEYARSLCFSADGKRLRWSGESWGGTIDFALR